MIRTITVARIYNLGDYQNITLTDTISDLSEEYISNPELKRTLRMLQFIEMEKEYRQYYLLGAKVAKVADKAVAIDMLTEKEFEYTDKLNELLKRTEE